MITTQLAHKNTIFLRPFWRLTLLCAVVLSLALLLSSPRHAHAQDAAPDVVPPAQAALLINEFMASNGSFAIDTAQPERTPDWIEIYNPGAVDVDMKGLSLSDDPNKPDKNPITQTVTISAGGYVLFFEGEDANKRPLSAHHFTFGLSAAGESIGLYLAATGERVDLRDFGPQVQDVSEGRYPDGDPTNWRVFSVPTPGESNSKNAPVIVSVQRNIVQPQAGQSVDVTAVITDNGSIVSATLVYTVANTATELPMASLGGDSYKATIPGFDNNTFVPYQVRAVDDEANKTSAQWDGYVVGYVAPVLRINEFMAENPSAVEDADDPGEFPDWMELYNPTDAPISLNGLFLSDNRNEPTLFSIPSGLSVPAKGFLIFWLDGDAGKGQGPNHTTFSLNKDGEFLGLYGAQGTVLIDGLTFGKQTDNVGMGRFPDGAGSANDAGSFQFLVCATAGKANMACDKKTFMPSVRVPAAQ